MDIRATKKAKAKLARADRTLQKLKNTKTLDCFSDEWVNFLIASKGVYTALEQGAKVSPQSSTWLGSKKSERKKDPLLQYMFQARNSAEHSLEEDEIEKVPGSVKIGVAAPGFSNNITINKFVMEKGKITALDVSSNDGLPVKNIITNPSVKLKDVSVRGTVYSPPSSHLGRELSDNHPVTVAELYLTYLKYLIMDAEKLIIS